MRFGLTLIGALFVAGTLAIGQTRPDLTSLERKADAAQLALDQSPRATADEREFRDLQDDLAYLRVKARRGETITDRERRDLSQRFDAFTNRVKRTSGQSANSGQSGGWNRPDRSGTTRGNRGNRSDRAIPAGSELDVRLQTRLYSDEAQVEDRVEATTVADLYQGDDLLVPAGSVLVGQVTAVDKASRTDRKGSITVEFNRLTVNGQTRDVRASVVDALESSGIKGEIGRIGAGAGVGAIIGGILGGMKGAITGILIGAGGVLVATEGKDVDLPVGTMLRVHFDDAVPLTDQ